MGHFSQKKKKKEIRNNKEYNVILTSLFLSYFSYDANQLFFLLHTLYMHAHAPTVNKYQKDMFFLKYCFMLDASNIPITKKI